MTRIEEINRLYLESLVPKEWKGMTAIEWHKKQRADISFEREVNKVIRAGHDVRTLLYENWPTFYKKLRSR